MLRAVLYNQAMAEYILAEYNAWLGGEHQSSLSQPTFWDTNNEITKLLGNPDLLSLVDKYTQPSDDKIPGNELCFLHDEQLMSVAMRENSDKLFNLTRTPEEEVESDLKEILGDDYNDEEAREEMRQELLKDDVDHGKLDRTIAADMHLMEIDNSQLLPSPNFFDRYLNNSDEYNETRKLMKRCSFWLHFSTVFCILALWGIMFDDEDPVNLANWLKWAISIIGTIVIYYIFEKGFQVYANKKPRMKKLNELIDDTNDDYSTKGGYVYIPKKILKKKDVVGSFLNNFK